MAQFMFSVYSVYSSPLILVDANQMTTLLGKELVIFVLVDASQEPVVQNFVCLTSSLRPQLVKYMYLNAHYISKYTLLFFVDKM